ncbi:ABC transporter permease [Anaerocolumna sp. MB42-C2]|uniref:ABC transporter permease n=1 Tax=Anaerocolumna sp. MB42-C2 TaxID=3070997 RepID=UPI0027DFC9C8|nr:ABC transporter permease [Anaerocolumna sp. MB42-C2]WMJ86518.1 ABC transporter permease [Anaerocolumna sp. MB42-C2]
MTILLGVLVEGLAYGIMALGVYITYKILDFPDLSVDGTFPLGGAVTAVLIIAGVNPLLTLFISFIIGGFAGMITGIIHVKFKVRDLLSGIIMMTALYSINLRIAGKANQPIFSKETIFENTFLTNTIPAGLKPFTDTIILLIIVVIMKLLLDLYLKTRSGYLLRSVGDNDTLVTSLAKDKGTVKIIGLAIANAFVALAGSIYTQKSGFFDISFGTGTIVIGLASVIIGTNLFKSFSAVKATTAVIIGSVIYKACVSFAISLGMAASDLKLVTSVLFLLILILGYDRKRKVKTNA